MILFGGKPLSKNIGLTASPFDAKFELNVYLVNAAGN